MSALAEALLAAQRQAVGAVTKVYLANDEHPETHTYGHVWVTNLLDAMGLTDEVDQARLLASLDILRALGAQAPANGTTATPKEAKPASEAQWKLIRRLADERGQVAPEGPLTVDEASRVIEQLKAPAA